LSYEARQRVISLYETNYSVLDISRRLEAEKVDVTARALYNLVQKYRLKGTIAVGICHAESCLRFNRRDENFMEDNLLVNDELTSTAMKNLLLEKWPDLVVSIKRVRRGLG